MHIFNLVLFLNLYEITCGRDVSLETLLKRTKMISQRKRGMMFPQRTLDEKSSTAMTQRIFSTHQMLFLQYGVVRY